jgi:hypothetical protein
MWQWPYVQGYQCAICKINVPIALKCMRHEDKFVREESNNGILVNSVYYNVSYDFL